MRYPLQDSPRAPKNVLRPPQEGPQDVPRSSKTSSSKPQNAVRRHTRPPKHSKALQGTPKWVQVDAESWQIAPTRLPKHVQDTQRHFQHNLKPIKTFAYVMLVRSSTQRFLTDMHALLQSSSTSNTSGDITSLTDPIQNPLLPYTLSIHTFLKHI